MFVHYNNEEIELPKYIENFILWLTQRIDDVNTLAPKDKITKETMHAQLRLELSQKIEREILRPAIQVEQWVNINKLLNSNVYYQKIYAFNLLYYNIAEYNEVLLKRFDAKSPDAAYFYITQNFNNIDAVCKILSYCGFTAIGTAGVEINQIATTLIPKITEPPSIIGKNQSDNDEINRNAVSIKAIDEIQKLINWSKYKLKEIMNIDSHFKTSNVEHKLRVILSSIIEIKILPLMHEYQTMKQDRAAKQSWGYASGTTVESTDNMWIENSFIVLFAYFSHLNRVIDFIFNPEKSSKTFYLKELQFYIKNPSYINTLYEILCACEFTAIDLTRVKEQETAFKIQQVLEVKSALVRKQINSTIQLDLIVPDWIEMKSQQIVPMMYISNTNNVGLDINLDFIKTIEIFFASFTQPTDAISNMPALPDSPDNVYKIITAGNLILEAKLVDLLLSYTQKHQYAATQTEAGLDDLYFVLEELEKIKKDYLYCVRKEDPTLTRNVDFDADKYLNAFNCLYAAIWSRGLYGENLLALKLESISLVTDGVSSIQTEYEWALKVRENESKVIKTLQDGLQTHHEEKRKHREEMELVIKQQEARQSAKKILKKMLAISWQTQTDPKYKPNNNNCCPPLQLTAQSSIAQHPLLYSLNY
ncbi:MAG: hypothetical protein WC748_08105 [Legionellales bacterium]